MLQEQFESADSQHACSRTMDDGQWTNSVGWFSLCNIRQSALTGISGNRRYVQNCFLSLLEQIKLNY